MSDDVDWFQSFDAAVSDETGRLAVLAHTLLGGVSAVQAAIDLAMCSEPLGESRDSLLLLARRRLDVMTETLRNLSTGLAPDAVMLAGVVLDHPSEVDLRAGTHVELHSSFNDSWVPGFEIAESDSSGYRVRRATDGSVLPGHVSAADLRVDPDRGRT